MKQPLYPTRMRPSCKGLVVVGVAAFIMAVVRPSQSLAVDMPSTRHAAADTKLPAQEKVNALLAKADADIRTGLLQLSDEFPQLKTTNFHTLAKDLEGKPDLGTVDVSVGHYAAAKGGQRTPVKKEDTYAIVVFLRRQLPADNDPNAPGPQMDVDPVYEHLGLVGRIHATAGDEKLDAALKKLVDEALAPLATLNKEAGG